MTQEDANVAILKGAYAAWHESEIRGHSCSHLYPPCGTRPGVFPGRTSPAHTCLHGRVRRPTGDLLANSGIDSSGLPDGFVQAGGDDGVLQARFWRRIGCTVTATGKNT